MSPSASPFPWDMLDDEHAHLKEAERRVRSAQQLDHARSLVRAAGLCGHCRHGLCYRLGNREEPIVWCDYGMSSRPVPPMIRECTRYQPEGELALPELARLAKVVEGGPDRSGHYW